jgi:hypothetical protein
MAVRRRQQVNDVKLLTSMSVTGPFADGSHSIYQSMDLRNDSILSLYQVGVRVTVDGRPWSGEIDHNGQKLDELRGPGGMWDSLGQVTVGADIDPNNVVIAVTFRDAAGRWWRLGQLGLIEDITDEMRKLHDVPFPPEISAPRGWRQLLQRGEREMPVLPSIPKRKQ